MNLKTVVLCPHCKHKTLAPIFNLSRHSRVCIECLEVFSFVPSFPLSGRVYHRRLSLNVAQEPSIPIVWGGIECQLVKKD
jgi:hypothetical protein